MRLKLIFATLTLLFVTLACNAAERLLFPPTQTPQPTLTFLLTLSPIPALPTLTPTVQFEAACPALVTDIIEKATASLDEEDTEKNHDEGKYLVTYTLDGEEFDESHSKVVPESLRYQQNDRPTHEAIWSYFITIIPPEERDMVHEFTIFTDGRYNYLAAVAQTDTSPKEWALEVDILDAKSYYDLTFTLIHEHGHLLTLTAKQVPPSSAIYENPEDQEIYNQEVSACPQYFTGEGCSKPDSYINEFFNRFWTNLYEEWGEIDRIEDEDEYYDELDEFYETYHDQFLSDYAPTSPAEDIAESWTFFVLSPKPELNSIADEKILFFYEYPELVALRMTILNNICESFPK